MERLFILGFASGKHEAVFKMIDGALYRGTPYGGDIIKAYRKKFAVDRMKAVAELQMLGIWESDDQGES